MAITIFQVQAAQRRAQQRMGESNKRARLRPLRDEVNRLLKKAGIRRAKLVRRAVYGEWCVEAGWLTDSDTLQQCVTVKVEINDRNPAYPQALDDLRARILQALATPRLSVTQTSNEVLEVRYTESAAPSPAPAGEVQAPTPPDNDCEFR